MAHSVWCLGVVSKLGMKEGRRFFGCVWGGWLRKVFAPWGGGGSGGKREECKQQSLEAGRGHPVLPLASR